MTEHRRRREAGLYEPPDDKATDELASLTKDELLDLADERGLDVPATATKAEIRAALEAG